MAQVGMMRAVLEGLISRLSPGLHGDALGEILNRLLWITDDNGTDVVEVCREWLDSDDICRVEAAVSLDEGWLYEDREELQGKLAEVGRRWPQLLPRIEEIVCGYDSQHGRPSPP